MKAHGHARAYIAETGEYDMEMLEYALAGYNGRQTDAFYSSPVWYAEQAGKFCKTKGITPEEVKMGRGYSVVINRDFVIKFDSKTDAPTITRK
jgi:hypothetical protein